MVGSRNGETRTWLFGCLGGVRQIGQRKVTPRSERTPDDGGCQWINRSITNGMFVTENELKPSGGGDNNIEMSRKRYMNCMGIRWER